MEYFVTFSDLAYFFNKWKRCIGTLAVAFALVGMLYGLTRPLEYEVTASFRDKFKAQSTFSSTMLLLSASPQTTHGEAVTLFRSRTLQTTLIQRLGLQASVAPHTLRFPRLTMMRDNFRVELTTWFGGKKPILADFQSEVYLENLEYLEVEPLSLQLLFLNEEEYEVTGLPETAKARGKIGEPLINGAFTFTLHRFEESVLEGKKYQIHIASFQDALNQLSQKLIVEQDKDDRSLIRLRYRAGERWKAKRVLNTLMAIYQEYLQEEQFRFLNKQVEYLRERQVEMEKTLHQRMLTHAKALSSEVISIGFPDAQLAMNALAQTQQRYAQQQLAIDLELKRFSQLKRESVPAHHLFSLAASGENEILTQMRMYKQQADVLDLALRDSEGDEEGQGESIEKLMEQAALINKREEEIGALLYVVQSGEIPEIPRGLIHDSSYGLTTWAELLLNSPPSEREFACMHLSQYLERLLHLTRVEYKTVQEKMTYRRTSPKELQGITLATAQELYLSYNQQLHQTEKEIMQKRFLVEQLQDLDFEVSSLSTILTDSISLEMIQHISLLTRSLRDKENRSQKELERLNQEIILYKNFLILHLRQTEQLLSVHETLLKSKIKTIQWATVEALHREISIHEEHVKDFINDKIAYLQLERRVIEGHQKDLQREMSLLPSRWISGKMIDHQMELNKRMVEEVTRLVESKNIESNLQVIQSAPLDHAVLERHSLPPHIVFFSFFGGLVGLLLGTGAAVAQAVWVGVPLSKENLLQAGSCLIGTLSPPPIPHPLRDRDLQTLRRLVTFLTLERNSSSIQTVLILNHAATDFSRDLAELMAKRGLKVLLLPLLFDKDEYPNQEGVLQYLEGSVQQPNIVRGDLYDILYPGGTSRFASEKLCTPAFSLLLRELQEKYDYIIASTNSGPSTAEVEMVVQLFGQIVIPITTETWEEIGSLLKKAQLKQVCCLQIAEHHG